MKKYGISTLLLLTIFFAVTQATASYTNLFWQTVFYFGKPYELIKNLLFKKTNNTSSKKTEPDIKQIPDQAIVIPIEQKQVEPQVGCYCFGHALGNSIMMASGNYDCLVGNNLLKDLSAPQGEWGKIIVKQRKAKSATTGMTAELVEEDEAKAIVEFEQSEKGIVSNMLQSGHHAYSLCLVPAVDMLNNACRDLAEAIHSGSVASPAHIDKSIQEFIATGKPVAFVVGTMSYLETNNSSLGVQSGHWFAVVLKASEKGPILQVADSLNEPENPFVNRSRLQDGSVYQIKSYIESHMRTALASKNRELKETLDELVAIKGDELPLYDKINAVCASLRNIVPCKTFESMVYAAQQYREEAKKHLSDQQQVKSAIENLLALQSSKDCLDQKTFSVLLSDYTEKYQQLGGNIEPYRNYLNQ